MHRTSIALLVLMAAFALAACGRAAPQAINGGNEAFSEQDFSTALSSYERARQEAPDRAEPYYNSGNVHYRQGELQDAQDSYDQALLKTDEGLMPGSSFNLGNTFFGMEDYGQAIEAYKEVLRVNPDDQDAKHNLELALGQLQQVEQENEQQRDEQGQQDDESDEQQDGSEGPEDPRQEEPEPEEQDGQEEQAQEQQVTGLTEEQARQLLESVGRDTETLQERLQRVFAVPAAPPERDW